MTHSELMRKIEERAEENANKVVGITKLAIETFKENYKKPDDLRPLVKIQYIKGAQAMLEELAKCGGEIDNRQSWDYWNDNKMPGPFSVFCDGAEWRNKQLAPVIAALKLKANDVDFLRDELSDREKELANLKSENQRLREALNMIASWSEGETVGSHFDDPGSATIARKALGK